jgi:5-methylcytosine-specific restriction protein B
LLGWGQDIDFTDCTDKAAIEKKIKLDGPTLKKPTSNAWFVDYFKHEMKSGDLILVSQGNSLFRAIAEVTGEYEFADDAPFHQMRTVRWLAIFEGGTPADEVYKKEVGMSTLYKLNPSVIQYDRINELLSEQASAEPVQPHVLVIDEINRANISKVLGELITLIEPDKREGAENAITVTLPYSGDPFTIPSNLHIVGTMNTADRSIALLDTALRRRFDFVEVMPEPDLLKDIGPDGVDLTKLLAALNERVEALYDRDHTIGHAYFMRVKTMDDLEQVFRRRVLPLLQEYFFENWSKVRRVLNDLGEGDFVRKTKRPAIAIDGEDEFPEEDSVVYSVNKLKFPVQAYLRIYAGK